MSDLTKLDQLKAAYEGSTQGKWETSVLMAESGPKEWTVCMEGGGDMLADMTGCPDEKANAVFVALAHNLMPTLLEAVELLKVAAHALESPCDFSPEELEEQVKGDIGEFLALLESNEDD